MFTMCSLKSLCGSVLRWESNDGNASHSVCALRLYSARSSRVQVVIESGMKECASRSNEAQDLGKPSRQPEDRADDDFVRALSVIQSHGSWRYHKDKQLRQLKLKVEPSLVLKIIKSQRSTPRLSWDFFVWAKKQMGYKHTSETYNTMIQILSDIRRFTPVWFLLTDMHKAGHCLYPDNCVRLAKSLGSVGMVDRAVRSLNHMTESGQPPTTRHYNSLIDVLVMNGFQLKACMAYKEMLKAGCQPDSRTFSLLIRGLIRMQQLELACSICEDMHSMGCEPDAMTMSNLIVIFCEAGRIDDAWASLSKMKEHGIRPNAGRYDILLSSLGTAGRYDDALKLLKEMSDQGYSPSKETVHHLSRQFSFARISE